MWASQRFLRDLLELHARLLRGLFGLRWFCCLLLGFGVLLVGFFGVFASWLVTLS